jgi:Fe-S oxidoreductase
MRLLLKGWSYANLARLLVQNLLGRLLKRFTGGDDALATYRQQYGQDGYVELPGPDTAVHVKGGACTSCGLCLTSCPAFHADLGMEGNTLPYSLAKSLSRSPTEMWAASDIVWFCAGCRRCEQACPESIPISSIAASARGLAFSSGQGLVPQSHRRAVDNIRTKLNPFGRPFAGFPEFEKEKARYVVFLGCLGNFRKRRSARRTLELLRHLGVDFTTVRESCSGGFLADMGLLDQSYRGADSNLRAILAKGTDRVLFQCPTCMLTMRDHPLYAGRLATEHLTSFLARLDLPRVSPARGPVAYHDACRMGRGLGLYAPPRAVLARAGIEVRELDETRERAECAGFGAGFSGMLPRDAITVARRRVLSAVDSGTRTLLTDCWGAALQLERAADLQVMTVAEFLGEGWNDQHA